LSKPRIISLWTLRLAHESCAVYNDDIAVIMDHVVRICVVCRHIIQLKFLLLKLGTRPRRGPVLANLGWCQ
jgi:hypothetical protein